MRIPVLQRERAAILYMRKRFSYSINQLAAAFGRSVSLIHRIIKFNTVIGNLLRKDNRWGITNQGKKIGAARQQRQLMFFMVKWQAFILESEDEPP